MVRLPKGPSRRRTRKSKVDRIPDLIVRCSRCGATGSSNISSPGESEVWWIWHATKWVRGLTSDDVRYLQRVKVPAAHQTIRLCDACYLQVRGGFGPSVEDRSIRQKMMHQNLDKLVAEFISLTNNLPSDTNLMDFMIWSHERTLDPPTEAKAPRHELPLQNSPSS